MSDLVATLGRIARSPAFKFFLILWLILLLLIPLVMVGALVVEREGRANEARNEVARTWGGAQYVSGPMLVVPYSVRIVSAEGDKGEKRIERLEERFAVFLPEALTIDGKSTSKLLKRSIFDVSVYTTAMALEGRFAKPDVLRVDPNATDIRWRDAVLAIALSDVSGLKEAATLKLNGSEQLPFSPSIGVPGRTQNGIHVPLAGSTTLLADPAAGLAPFSFDFKLDFTGSNSLTFAPAARETRVSLSSDWPHPSFTGAYLPTDREVKDDGFTASWRIPHLARSVPDYWNLAHAEVDRLGTYAFGVNFYQSVDFYDLVGRAVKYAVLFLGLAFMAVLVLELTSKTTVHPVQYLFVGLAMIFFYVLLLSFAEHIGFAWSYLLASAATGSMLALYVGKVLRSTRAGLTMLALFAVLYAFLFLILRLEDYALLAGAILGFVALTAVMFITLRVDWGAAAREAPGTA